MKWLMKAMRRSKKSGSGFTLIELMIVVIVIAILAAAGVAMYMRAMDKARASEGLAVLGSLRTHYLVESADPTLPQPYPLAGTTAASWGVVTINNRWWVEGTGFTANFTGYTPATSYDVELTGIGTLVGITLTIDVHTGDITQVYP